MNIVCIVIKVHVCQFNDMQTQVTLLICISFLQNLKPEPFNVGAGATEEKEAEDTTLTELDTMVKGALDGDGSSKVDAKAKLAAMQLHLASLMSKIDGADAE